VTGTAEAAAWIADLKCGCQKRFVGHKPQVGGYITCTKSLAHQSTYRIVSVREERLTAQEGTEQ
jgi:hypothetical protein